MMIKAKPITGNSDFDGSFKRVERISFERLVMKEQYRKPMKN